MEGVGAMDPYEQFETRGNFVYRTIDTKTGLLPTEATPGDNLMTEIFIAGTEPTTSNPSARRTVEICCDSGYLATPECKEKGHVMSYNRIQRPNGQSWEKTLIGMNLWALSNEQKGALVLRLYDSEYDIPDYYCHLHNKDTKTYPVSPIAKYAKYNTKKMLEDYYKLHPDEDPGHTHTWENGVCTECGKECEHEYDENGVCTICGMVNPEGGGGGGGEPGGEGGGEGGGDEGGGDAGGESVTDHVLRLLNLF